MNVGELIERLEKYDKKLPIAVDDDIGFAEAYMENIIIERKKYLCFPFTKNDEFEYVNLRAVDSDI